MTSSSFRAFSTFIFRINSPTSEGCCEVCSVSQITFFPKELFPFLYKCFCFFCECFATFFQAVSFSEKLVSFFGIVFHLIEFFFQSACMASLSKRPYFSSVSLRALSSSKLNLSSPSASNSRRAVVKWVEGLYAIGGRVSMADMVKDTVPFSAKKVTGYQQPFNRSSQQISS